MCLAIPGKVLAIKDKDDPLTRAGTVDFQGNRVEVSLALVPQASEGSWVLVHAGYALECLDAKEALETWEWLKEAELVEEIPEELCPSV